MANVVLLFGHGSFDPKEVPPKATVPTGCKLCLFARHGEEISGERMTALSYFISRRNADLFASRADLLAHDEFMEEMKSGRHLRRIKVGGDQVTNYRLYPPTGLVSDVYGERSETGVKFVTVSESAGVTLQELFQLHGKPGRVFMWIACRAIEGTDRLPSQLTSAERADGSGSVTVYHREVDYFKASGGL